MRRTRKVKLRWLSQGIVGIFLAAFVALGLGLQPVNALGNSENASDKTRADGSPFVSKPGGSHAPRTLQKNNADQPFEAECPKEIKCIVMPAAYASNNNDVGEYGNYDKANRPQDMKINSIVVHDTEGDLQSVLDAFQDPTFYASSHYVIDKDGTVYQMVQNKDIAWHAGNWWYNMHSIGIEHVGFAHNGNTDYTPEMYEASATLTKWLAAKYNIPRDRQHVLGHDNVPAPTVARINNMHTDPGPYWNWQKYGDKAGLKLDNFHFSNKFVTIAPKWDKNKQMVTGCGKGVEVCVPENELSANFVYLRTEPDQNAPLIKEPVKGEGSTDIYNNNARVFYGQSLAIADAQFKREGIWYKVWVNGTSGWFFSSWEEPTAYPTKGKYITPKSGVQTVAIYGRPLPESNEYPADFTYPAGAIPLPEKLPYAINAGERYKVIDGPIKPDHYYAWTIDKSLPYDHTVFKGNQDYYLVQFGNRPYFVKASEVDVRKW